MPASHRPPTRILGLSTAVPEHAAAQDHLARFMSRVAAAAAPLEERARALALIERLYPATGIRRRHSVLRDFGETEPARFRFFPPNWSLEPFPTTAARMRVYEERSVELAAAAAREALARAGIDRERVTDLVLSTCTGFFAPGPDVALVEELGLPLRTRRTLVGFMGCHAGIDGMRLAGGIVQADPDAVVLQVCVELCSLHFQKHLRPELLVANSLFADGAAAAVYSAAGPPRPGALELIACHSSVVAESREAMAWRIGDQGFEMRLSPAVPRLLERALPRFTAGLLERAALDRGQIASWAVHPGGVRILEAVEGILGLSGPALAASRETLRDFGNMSSATVFFVLERILERGGAEGEPVGTLAFGPGLTLEGAVLRRI